MHRYPQNQSYVGSSGQTVTTNVSMTLCDSQSRHQTHVLCGCNTFGTELKFYCLRQCTTKRGCQSVRQASSQSDRNTHFGFFVSGRHGSKQWGEYVVSESAVAQW